MKTPTFRDPFVLRLLLAGCMALGTVTISRPASAACESNQDCGFGFECARWTDHSSNSTTGGSDGSGGTSSSACDNGTCEWDETFETCPEDCKEVTECQPAECDGDEDCAQGYACEYAGSVAVTSSSGGNIIEHEYRCRLIPVACLTDDDCSDGEVCYIPFTGTTGTSATGTSTGTSGEVTNGSTSAGDSGSGGAWGSGSDGVSDGAVTGGDDGIDENDPVEGYCIAADDVGTSGAGGSDAGTTGIGSGPTDSSNAAGPTGTINGSSNVTGGGDDSGTTGASDGGNVEGASSGDTGTGTGNATAGGEGNGGTGGSPGSSSSKGDPGADGKNDVKWGCSVNGSSSSPGDLGVLAALGAFMLGWYQRRRRAVV